MMFAVSGMGNGKVGSRTRPNGLDRSTSRTSLRGISFGNRAGNATSFWGALLPDFLGLSVAWLTAITPKMEKMNEGQCLRLIMTTWKSDTLKILSKNQRLELWQEGGEKVT